MKSIPTHASIRTNSWVSCSGFTLVEILVVAGMIAILIAISIPTLSAVRSSASDVASMSNLRSCLGLVLVYAADNNNEAPVHPHNDTADYSDDYIKYLFPDGTFLTIPYFGQSPYWHARLIEQGYEATAVVFSREPDDSAPSSTTLWESQSSYILSQSFMASPAYWKRSASQSRDQWQIIRLDLTAYPSNKSFLHESTAGLISRNMAADPLKTPRPVGFVDAHVDSRSLSEATKPVPNSLYRNFTSPLQTTEDGVLGRDF